MTSEREFIRELQQRFVVRPPVLTGIGDDGAVLSCDDQSRMIVVTDMLLDQVHFDLRTTSPRLVGRKSIAVNVSDLAAMGSWPTAAFVSIVLPKDSAPATQQFLDQWYSGIQDLADQFEFTIAGGDTNSWNGPFAINVCLTGMPIEEQAVLRSGAKAGDALFVRGPLGGSLQTGRLLTFEPRLTLAANLLDRADLHAMMDISDGLSLDLHRMMEASKTGAMLIAEDIPVHSDVALIDGLEQPLHHALSDGEDFELLFSVSQADAERLSHSDLQLHRIGTVTDRAGFVELIHADGTVSAVGESGWQHL